MSEPVVEYGPEEIAALHEATRLALWRLKQIKGRRNWIHGDDDRRQYRAVVVQLGRAAEAVGLCLARRGIWGGRARSKSGGWDEARDGSVELVLIGLHTLLTLDLEVSCAGRLSREDDDPPPGPHAVYFSPSYCTEPEFDYLDDRVIAQIEGIVADLGKLREELARDGPVVPTTPTTVVVVGTLAGVPAAQPGPSHADTRSTGDRASGAQGDPRNEKNRRVRDYLVKKPDATSEQVGKALGYPAKTVRGMPAWQERDANRPRNAAPKGRIPQEHPLTDNMLAVAPADVCDPVDEAGRMEVIERRYVETLDDKGRAEFYSLSQDAREDRLTTFLTGDDGQAGEPRPREHLRGRQ